MVGWPTVVRGSWLGVLLTPRDTTTRKYAPDASRMPFTSSVRRSMLSSCRGVTSSWISSAFAAVYSRRRCACTTWPTVIRR